jgi:hypothetical protein
MKADAKGVDAEYRRTAPRRRGKGVKYSPRVSRQHAWVV